MVIDRILREYGSVFVVDEKAVPPPVCMFTNADEVENFQKNVRFVGAEIAGTRIECCESTHPTWIVPLPAGNSPWLARCCRMLVLLVPPPPDRIRRP